MVIETSQYAGCTLRSREGDSTVAAFIMRLAIRSSCIQTVRSTAENYYTVGATGSSGIGRRTRRYNVLRPLTRLLVLMSDTCVTRRDVKILAALLAIYCLFAAGRVLT